MPLSEEAIIQIVKTVIPVVCGSGVIIAMIAIGAAFLFRRRKLPADAMQAIIDLNDRISYLERRLEEREDEVRELRSETKYLKGFIEK